MLAEKYKVKKQNILKIFWLNKYIKQQEHNTKIINRIISPYTISQIMNIEKG